MTFDLAKILPTKHEFRKRLAARPLRKSSPCWTLSANARSLFDRRGLRRKRAFCANSRRPSGCKGRKRNEDVAADVMRLKLKGLKAQ